MTQKILLWPDITSPEQSTWALFIDDVLQQSGQGFNEFPNNDDNDLVLMIPSEEVLLTQVPLPKMRRKQLQLALPFALEEQLIPDVDLLHFATGEMQPDNIWPVAIIAKEKLQQWLAFATSFNLKPTAIIPDVLTLPFTDKQWTVLVNDTRCIVRTGIYSGFTAERNQLNTLLNAARQGAVQPPERIHFLSTTQTELTHPNDVAVDSTVLPENELLARCYETLETQPSMNLLQGEWQQNQYATSSRKIWQIAGALAIAWLVILFSSQIISLITLHNKSTQLNQSIHAIYHRYFPTATSVVAPKERLQQKLNAVHGDSQQNVFLPLLASTGEVLLKNPAAQLKQLEFNHHILRLDIEANTFDALDALVTQLKTTGLQVKQQSAAVNGRSVKASLLIQRGHV
ncbi:MAG: type II secretion system protein GspL [Gammaproteobacteria bacterium]|nr:type II secretion system protein GspL [Gammaproteobacteria bacterium]